MSKIAQLHMAAHAVSTSIAELKRAADLLRKVDDVADLIAAASGGQAMKTRGGGTALHFSPAEADRLRAALKRLDE